ncbi:MAG TPA: aminotransferase class III-fold pyridoxal phosphate-dependent enzyme, partial [Pyrinomonadaceae bacterium]
QGIQLGPRLECAREVAALICELTGHERVAFCNSGTEAVMTALRLARASTGRSRIALFSGSYHGHSDGTLAIAESHDKVPSSIPMAPGVPHKVAEDVVVLEYGSRKSLDYLRAHAGELACVLVEPVQSRNPALQPRAFLQELREITTQTGSLLIFDEMVTGFRIAPGGAQSWFGVKADLATYGKIVGGGMPVGIVAGRAAFMDGIDGGVWTYGDASYPRAETTFFGGTFCMHPLTMAAALSTLKHLKREGPQLQHRLNQRTSELASSLNAYFEETESPLRMANFGSVFRFVHSGNMDLFYYHLLLKGIYVWEWRSCFLSTAHTEEDYGFLTRSIKESLEEMRDGGFLPERASGGAGQTTPPNGNQETKTEAAARIEEREDKIDDERLATNSGQFTARPEALSVDAGTSPLSEAQKQLWLLSRMSAEASLAYHESVIVEFQGALNVELMREAFRRVVNRHEALRSAISREGDCQRVLPALEFDVPLVDFTATKNAERERAIGEWLRAEAARPFELTEPPLLRASILRTEDDRHLLALTAHHIVIDSWSLSILLEEVAAIYSAGLEPQDFELPRPQQFAEYLRELSAPIYHEHLKRMEAYWREQFSGPVPVLSLAAARPPVKTYRGSSVSLKIDADLTARLKTYSRRSGCTLFMTLFACYTTLLHRLTGQQEIVVGIPVSGRFIEGSQYLVGYCTHLLAVVSRLTESATFDEHLRSSRGHLLEAYEHQEYPFARLINLLNPPRDLSRTPVIQTTFNLEPNALLPAFAGLNAKLGSAPVYYTKFDAGVNVTDVDKELRVEFDYNTDLFDATTAERIARQFELLLKGVLARPAEPLTRLPLMTDAEAERLLREWNETAADFPETACVHELVEAQARLMPERAAVVFNEEQLSYGELNRRANQLAHRLRRLGLAAESRVGLCFERSAEMMIGLLGILKAGCAYVPLDPEYPQGRLSYMLADAGAAVLLTQPHLSARFKDVTAQVLELDALALDDESIENPKAVASADNLAYVIYTSGSTGQPKGVEITHKAFVNLLSSMQRLPGLSASDTLLAVTTISFDIAALELFLSLIAGARLMIASRDEARDGRQLARLLSDPEVSVMQATPATWRLLLESGWTGSRGLKILCGGEALPRKLAAQLLTCG